MPIISQVFTPGEVIMKFIIANKPPRRTIIFAPAGGECNFAVTRLEYNQLDMMMHLLRAAHLPSASIILISCIINENSNEIISRLERVMRSTRSAQKRDPPVCVCIQMCLE
jgi:hypothetical protein